MASESCLQLTLGFFGLLCCALTLYIVFFWPEISVDDSRLQERPAVERFVRKEREAANDKCVWVLIARESVKTLKSPNYPEPYPSNAYCQWLLTTLHPNDTITLKIEALSIEPDEECRLDSLQVFLGSSDRATSLGSFCGNVNDRIVETNSSTLLLVFRSDAMYEDKGFAIDYFIPTDKGCQEVLTDSSDTLTSPGFPDNYPDATDCSTIITLPDEDKKIVLQFDSVDLEYGENCTFDYIQIFDGKDTNSVLLGQICQESDTLSFESSSNSLLVHFHSDSTVNKRGYRARYFSVDPKSKLFGNCHWESGEGNGTVTSPNYPNNYPSFANCSLWIRAPENNRILVTFDAVFLEMESNCSYDFLQIDERDRYCGRGTEPKSLLSGGNEIHIQFQSDSFVEFRGFQLRYEFIKEVESVEESSNELFTLRVKPQNVTLAAGSSHMLHCDTEYPNAKIRWLKEEVFLARGESLAGLKLLENGTLWIRNMQLHLAGQYTCVAVAPEEEVVAKAYVRIQDDCGIEFRKTPSDSEFEEGEFAHMECLAAIPDVQLSWEKDGRPLRQHVTVLKNGYIFMERVTLEDAGLYSCIARDVATGCVQKASAFLNVSHKTEIEDICGKSKSEEARDRGKIVGGDNAPKGAYPWQIMLWEPERKSFCGATLLNERWIATAAHCIINKYNMTWDRIVVKLGKYDRERDEEEEKHNAITDSSAILYHPLFQQRTYDNDLALIRLKHRVYFTDHIRPVCLPDRNLSESLLAVGNGDSGPKMGTVVGWGKLKESGPLPRFLQEIKVPVVEDEVCKRSTNFSVTRNMFCAGYSQEVIGDSCQGDSGGPFLMKHEGRWYILGIVSWGEGCGKTNKYGFYTRLSNHLSWIQGIIKS